MSSVHGQRRSVRLELNHLDIDIVPAISERRDPSTIKVPDRESGEWIKSSPQRHSENATRINKKHKGKFKPLVKLMKLWNSNLPETVRCKSFMIETIAVRLFGETQFDALEHGMLLFWDFLVSRYSEPAVYRWHDSFGMSFGWLSVSVPDAAGTGSNTAGRVDDSRARALAVKARISRDLLLSAQKARTDTARQNAVLDALRA